MKNRYHLVKNSNITSLILVGCFFLVYGFNYVIEVKNVNSSVVSSKRPQNLTTSKSLQLRFLTPNPTESPNSLTPTPYTISLDSTHWKKMPLPFSNQISNIYRFSQTKDGDIWGIGGAKIYQFHNKNWYQYELEKIPEVHGKILKSIVAKADGSIWFGTDLNEIISFDGKSWSSETVRSGGFRTNIIEAIIFEKSGELCAISIEGLSCRNSNKNWTYYDFVQEKVPFSVQDVALSPSGDIWISLSNGFLYHFNEKKWENFSIDDWLGPIASSSDGGLWIYSKGKIGKRSIDGTIMFSDVYPFLYDYPPIDMFESNDGVLWLGCVGYNGYGILRYLKDEVFETVDGKELSTKDYGPSPHILYPFGIQVNSIFQDQDENIWFGTSNGLFRYHE